MSFLSGKKAMTTVDRIVEAVEIATNYGPYNGDHHRRWVIHEMVKTLCMFNDAQLEEWSKAVGFEDMGIKPRDEYRS
jgi:hypothetical protein